MSKWYPKNGRVIFHVDMNSFYASVEAAYDTSLKGKPLAIAGNPEERRGIVVTSSYEARAKGVKTTMPLWEAKKLCPNLIVMRPNFDRYRKASSEMFKMLAAITPCVQPVSIDEGYMDITECVALGSPIEIAERLQKQIIDELDIPCSIGIAPNKFLAKMASDMKKPMGITVLRKRDLATKLWPLPVDAMHGIGAKTAEKLNKVDIITIKDLIEADTYSLKRLLGINGERLQNRANGIDLRPVDPDAIYDFKSIGNSETLPEDTIDDREIQKLIRKLARKVSARLKRKEVVGQHVQITIRFHDRKTITRSLKLSEFIEEEETIFSISNNLFEKHWNGDPIRLLGVTVQDLVDKKEISQQLNLFTYEKAASKEKLFQTMEKLTERYGENTFKKIKQVEDKSQPRTSFQKDYLDDYKK
ncbi:DNA polymerase IV [Paraliobacillus sediminis]|uniref:DNA polymerase IV n=1 Tax=Paraliobacillus sediminis TaxID=1885916 RepID=UPI000E3C67C9|nr:DNA polymerase IV [Paraliobacillus sediminis]